MTYPHDAASYFVTTQADGAPVYAALADVPADAAIFAAKAGCAASASS
jgi:hypothetical protein